MKPNSLIVIILGIIFLMIFLVSGPFISVLLLGAMFYFGTKHLYEKFAPRLVENNKFNKF